MDSKEISKNKKGLTLVVIISGILLISVLFVNFVTRKIHVKDFKEEKTIEVLSKYKNQKISACYGNKLHCKKLSYKVKGVVNTKKKGTYKVIYKIDYKNKHLLKKETVNVVDSTKPKLVVDGEFKNVCPNGKVDDIELSATDNYDGDITSKIVTKLENNKITYKVSDSSGNTTTKEFDVQINDNEKPSISLTGGNTLYLGVGSRYEEPGFVADDNCDGIITDKVKVTGSVDTSREGTYELNYNVSDIFGNTSSAKRIVKVFSKNSYNPENLGNKVIYLTFDDGPGAYTARLLDILGKYNVKATFFVTGYSDKFNDLLKREASEGHTVALHSYTHNYALIYTSLDAYMNDLIKIQNKVKEYTGIESKIIRFPGGSSNTVSRKYKQGIMSELSGKLSELGFRYFDWTISSGDAGQTKDSNKVFLNVTSQVKPDHNNVVLMHDIKPYTVDAVERIIEFGLSNGYTFAPLAMNSPEIHQHINN